MSTPNRTPGLLRRLAAMAYDGLALFSVLFVADALVVIPFQAIGGITNIGTHSLFQLYQALIIVGFFGWFWTHGGQTLGLRTWHMRLVRDDGGPLTRTDALKRLAGAVISWLPLGLGFLWILVDRQGLAWHDRLSGTRPVMTED